MSPPDQLKMNNGDDVKVLEERAAIAEGVAPWDVVLHEWFRVRDINHSGGFDEEEYVTLNRKMHPRYAALNGDVPFDEQAQRDKFQAMDTNHVSCMRPSLVILICLIGWHC